MVEHLRRLKCQQKGFGKEYENHTVNGVRCQFIEILMGSGNIIIMECLIVIQATIIQKKQNMGVGKNTALRPSLKARVSEPS